MPGAATILSAHVVEMQDCGPPVPGGAPSPGGALPPGNPPKAGGRPYPGAPESQVSS